MKSGMPSPSTFRDGRSVRLRERNVASVRAAEEAVEGHVLIRVVQHQPAGTAFRGLSDEFAVLHFPIRLAESAPSVQVRRFERPIGDETGTHGPNFGEQRERETGGNYPSTFTPHLFPSLLNRTVLSQTWLRPLCTVQQALKPVDGATLSSRLR